MVITAVEQYKKGKYKIYLNEEFAFLLFRAEVRRLGIEEGKELEEQVYQEILEEILLKRAKNRALYLLQAMERTEKQMREKLKDNLYPEEVIERVCIYMKEYHFLDDASYARRYVESRSLRKSRRQIQMELLQKGISSSLIREIFEETENHDLEAICALIRKKQSRACPFDEKQRQRLFQSLQRKGYPYEQIKRAFRECLEEPETGSSFD